MQTNNDYGLVTRLKALHDVLLERACTKAEIFRELPQYYGSDTSSNRRLGRDVAALRQLGYQISVDRSMYSYALQETLSLEMSDAEVQALAVMRETFATLLPLSADLLPLLERIAAALSERQRRLYDRSPSLTIQTKPAADYRSSLKTLRLLKMAIEQGRKLRLVYPALDDQRPITHLGVEPYEIQFFDRHFYLLGFSPHDPQMLEFRIDRIRDLELLAGKTTRHRSRKTLAFSYRLSARIARAGISERFPNQQVTHNEDGSALVQAEGYSEFRIIQELLRYGEQAELLGPADLRTRMTAVVAAMSSLYGISEDK